MPKFESNYDVDNKALHYQVKLDLWHATFGLQKVDNLIPSEYMWDLATQNIQDNKLVILILKVGHRKNIYK